MRTRLLRLFAALLCVGLAAGCDQGGGIGEETDPTLTE